MRSAGITAGTVVLSLVLSACSTDPTGPSASPNFQGATRTVGHTVFTNWITNPCTGELAGITQDVTVTEQRSASGVYRYGANITLSGLGVLGTTYRGRTHIGEIINDGTGGVSGRATETVQGSDGSAWSFVEVFRFDPSGSKLELSQFRCL
jgi:hypothetical protein